MAGKAFKDKQTWLLGPFVTYDEKERLWIWPNSIWSNFNEEKSFITLEPCGFVRGSDDILKANYYKNFIKYTSGKLSKTKTVSIMTFNITVRNCDLSIMALKTVKLSAIMLNVYMIIWVLHKVVSFHCANEQTKEVNKEVSEGFDVF